MGVLTKTWYALVLILIILLLFYGGTYDLYREEKFSLDKYLKIPGKYEGHKGQRFGKIVNISQEYFYLDLGTHTIKVIGSGVKKAVYGETVFFIDFKRDGIMELIDYHNYNYNYFLYIVSFFAFLLFIYIFFKEWKLTLGGFKDA